LLVLVWFLIKPADGTIVINDKDYHLAEIVLTSFEMRITIYRKKVNDINCFIVM